MRNFFLLCLLQVNVEFFKLYLLQVNEEKTLLLRKDPSPQCEHCQFILTVRHILVECNHFARERKDIFGRRDAVESFIFNPTLVLLFLKPIEFCCKF